MSFLDKVIHFSIHNKLIIAILTLFLVVWGVYSFTQLPIDAVPDITNNQVQVITSSPSLAAQEVERLITFPVEVSLRNIPGVVEMRSVSRFGLSVITLVFTEETDVYWARQQVSERLRTAAQQIPKGVGNPDLAPVTTGLGEIYQYVLRPKKGYEKKYSATELRSIQDWIVRRQLLGTEGVAEVSSFGGFVKQYEIAIDPDKLHNLQVSMDEIFKALENNNQNTGGAYLDKQPQAYFIRSEGLIGSLDDIDKIVIRQMPNGLPVQIKDVAKVQFGSAVRYGAMTYNGEGEVVGAIVMMLKGENSSKVIKNVKERIEQVKKSLPEGIEIEAFLDRTKLVNKAIGTVAENLIIGALIVIFVLVLLLGNLRAGLVVASVIPLAMLFTVSMMNLFGISGNLMSLGAIDFGLIIDGAVIIVEATLHHLREIGGIKLQSAIGNSQDVKNQQFNNKAIEQFSNSEMDEEVYQSASKIRTSAAFGEIIILIVYLPILALVGVEGKMFRPMAQVVSFAILGAFILSLTYVPMASALFMSRKKNFKASFSDKLLAFLYRFYRPVLALALRQKIWFVGIPVLLLGFSLWIFSGLGGEFIPQLDEGDFAVATQTLTGSSLSETVDATLKAEKILKERFPDEVIKVVGKIGNSEVPTDPMPIEAADMMVILKEKQDWKKTKSTEELAQLMAEALADLPGVSAGFQQPIQMRFNELMTGNKQDVTIKIFGEDLNLLSDNAKKIANVVKTVAGAKDLYVEQVEGLPQIIVDFNRDKLARHNISIADANRTLNTAFAGSSAGLVFEGEKRFDLVVRLDQDNRRNLSDIQNLFVTTPKGEQVPLSQLGTVEIKTGVNQIQREDAKRRITVAFNVRGRDVESIVNELKTKIDKQVKLPAGYYVTYGGQFENLQEAKSRLMVAVPAALLLIFVLLYFTFHSFRQSLLIFTAVPLSAIGGILALWIRDMPFSISAGVGFIALFGVSVLNGIVLIGEFNHLRKSGINDLKEVIFQGTLTRFRPVLMTALVASLGFLPMALSNGAGAEVQKPLATVVIGGLISSTLLTLLVLPVLYLMIEGRSMGQRAGSGEQNFKDEKVVENQPIISILLIGFLLSFLCFSANSQPISLENAVQKALSENLNLKSGLYEIDYQKSLRKTAADLPKTNFSWTAGQYNSIRFDNNFSVSQNIPFPSTFRKRAEWLSTQVQTAESKSQLSQAELVREVKWAYYELLFLQNRQKRLTELEKVFIDFVKAAQVRLRTGESNSLEVSTAESQLTDIQILISQNEADFKSGQAQLQTLLNTSEAIFPIENIVFKKELKINLSDINWLFQHPAALYFSKQLAVSQAFTKVEKSNLLPDLTVGYFNQSLIGFQDVNNQEVFFNGSKRFQGFQLGLAVPLFFQPQKARIRAAVLQEKVAQTQLAAARKTLQSRYQQAFAQYEQARNSLKLYEEKSLPNADLLLKNATKAYQSGEIGYLEFSQSLNRALQIQLNYLDLLQVHNQTVIEIEYLVE